jgi:hypothetical protein
VRLQEVLLQRSDVETFLLSSLHTMRKEIERGSLTAALTGAGQQQMGSTAQGKGSCTADGECDVVPDAFPATFISCYNVHAAGGME